MVVNFRSVYLTLMTTMSAYFLFLYLGRLYNAGYGVYLVKYDPISKRYWVDYYQLTYEAQVASSSWFESFEVFCTYYGDFHRTPDYERFYKEVSNLEYFKTKETFTQRSIKITPPARDVQLLDSNAKQWLRRNNNLN